jgi:hypothetical protein
MEKKVNIKRAWIFLLLITVILMNTSCAKVTHFFRQDQSSKVSSSSALFDISKASYDDIYNQAVKLSNPLDHEIGLNRAQVEYDEAGNMKSFLLNIGHWKAKATVLIIGTRVKTDGSDLQISPFK